MVLYVFEFPAPQFPFLNIYARERDDISRCLEALRNRHPPQEDEMIKGLLADPSWVSRIQTADQGNLIYDLALLPCRPDHYADKFAELKLTSDFVARVRWESIPLFPEHQSVIYDPDRQRGGPLAEVKTFLGSRILTSCVPYDVAEALRGYDVTPLLSEAERHIRQLQADVARVFPRPSPSHTKA